MDIESFEMERWQSKWEHKVDYNLSESGVHPFSFKEMMDFADIEKVSDTLLGYIQTDGTQELKSRIARLYPNADEENILVTTGSSEANWLCMWSLLERGTQTLFMLPNFMQIYGLMRAFKAQMQTFYLKEEKNWQPDLKEIKKLVTKKTDIISVTNPNNPTGAQMSEITRETILDLARWSKAWLVCDEVYQGAELDGKTTPTFWNQYRKTIVCSGLSKSYGLSGLRVGWVVAPKKIIENLWKYKDYTTISISALSDRLACAALDADTRKKIFKRTRSIIKKNYPILESWMNQQKGLFHCVPPKAGAICFPKYNLPINASKLAEKILQEKSVLIQPGDHQKVDFHIRIGLGEKPEKFEKALDRIKGVFQSIS